MARKFKQWIQKTYSNAVFVLSLLSWLTSSLASGLSHASEELDTSVVTELHVHLCSVSVTLRGGKGITLLIAFCSHCKGPLSMTEPSLLSLMLKALHHLAPTPFVSLVLTTFSTSIS